MKKLVCILMAVAMIACLFTAAFAEGAAPVKAVPSASRNALWCVWAWLPIPCLMILKSWEVQNNG